MKLDRISILWLAPLLLLAGAPSGCMNCAKGGPPPDEPCVYPETAQLVVCNDCANGVWGCSATLDDPVGEWLSGDSPCYCIGDDGTLDREKCPMIY